MSAPADSGKTVPVRSVLLLGDTHGNLPWVKVAIEAAKQLDCDAILQLGDFGFWAHREQGRQFLNGVIDALDTAGIDLYWIDGNHENHDLLSEQVHQRGFWRAGSRLYHAARGSRWEWGGQTFLACGGAYSIDKEYRTEGESWWAGETITQDDADLCTDEGLCDVLVTHDAPAEASDAIPEDGTWDRKKDAWPESRANREVVSYIASKTLPKLLVHGHYHRRYSQHVEADGWFTDVEGFGCDGDWAGAMGVLDTRTLRVESVDAYPRPTAPSGSTNADGES